MKTSVLMTVHDREPEVLLACLRSLARSAPPPPEMNPIPGTNLGVITKEEASLSDIELVIVDDRSEMDYSWIRDYAKPRFTSVKWIRTGDYEGFRVDGYGNPARAFNVGLELCTGERLIVMSSDVIVTPGAVKSMDRFWSTDCLYTPRVIDLDRNVEYCGATRPFPMPWFLVMPTAVAQQGGGWDEKFLGGLCFEDNDFVGRMALRLGLIRCDWTATVYHQSHFQPAYEGQDEAVAEANRRNKDICLSKWGGIPFDGQLSCFTTTRRPDPSGCTRIEVQDEALKAKFWGVTA